MPAKKTFWIEVSSPVRAESERGIYSATYTFKELSQRGVIPSDKTKYFHQTTHLRDFFWRAYWSRGDIIAAGGRAGFLRKTDAVVVFMHGWDASEAIWENLPARLCADERNLLVLVPDVNGFGRSPFLTPENMDFDECDPAADMRAVETWLEVLGILGGRRHVPIIFVGHSMSGAALFYFREERWNQHPIGRCAIAPALLMNDILRKGFFSTLGVSIWAGARLLLEKLTETISPLVINQLIAGASKAVQAEHKRIFKQTHKSTLAHTFFAMGQAKRPTHKGDWSRFKVLLGHCDRLVGLDPMLNLLVELGFRSRQVRMVLGDHYFFSVGQHSRRLHSEGREITLEEIRDLVSQCRKSSRS
ncbi:MAG: alpha/beta hydrolase [Anaerolineales bacterium]|nr:alpha/beta hydrolase [Anaerolineales bacterium]